MPRETNLSLGLGLDGKAVLVTGAGSGIGRAAAILFSQAGAIVGCMDRDVERAGDVAREIEEAGGRAVSVPADVADAQAVEAGVKAFVKEAGRLDGLVASAGINGVWCPVEEMRPEEWEKTLRVNLTGTFFTVRAAVPHLKREGGAVVIVSSVNGNRVFSNAGASAYAVSKAGQVALGRMLALELAPSRVRVNTVCPGSIDTNIEQSMSRRNLAEIQPKVIYPDGVVPLGPGGAGTAEEVARTILFLASDAAGHITGTEVFVDGAESLLMG